MEDRDAPAAGPTAPDYHISAESSLADRRRYTLKHGDTFALLDPYGDFVSGSHEGLYHRDTRYLSHCRLWIGGKRPLLLSSDVEHDNVVLNVDMTNPDLFDGDRLVLHKDAVHLSRTIFLWDNCRYELLCARHFGPDPVRFMLHLDFAADFADLFEVRGFHRDRRGGVTAEAAGDRLRFVYESLDGQPRSTEISFTPAPSTLSRKAAVFELDLDPGEARNLVWVSRCTTQWTTPQHAKLPAALRGALRSERRSPSGHRWTRVDSSDAGVNAVLGRSRADLAMLCSQTPHGSYPYAGIPWFSTPFGRDGVITGLETLWLDPELSRGILQFLAAFQATVVDPDRDAEPGKILHEMRRGELAELGEIPFGRYYGSVDSTPLFIALAGKYLQRTGDLETLRSLWPAIEAGLDWLERYGDRDGDGFVDYGGGGGRGLANQGWKDSHDSVFHADGSFAVPPIALCEVQGYAYLARNEAAVVAHALGKDALAVALRQRAAALAEAFEETFWCDPIGMFGLALDGRRRLCQVRSSNAGQVLFSGIARREHAERVARELTATRFFTGWGIRTVAEGERRYNPCSYHNGSVWPHDNALIALGLARYGLSSAVREVTDAVLGAAHRMQLRRLPELFCGFRRRPDRGPTLYPVACAPQAWAAAAPFALLEACLNPRFDPAGGQLYFHKPQLPAGLQWLRIRGLRVGPATADVRLLRDGDGVRAEVANGELRVHVVD